MSSMTEEKSATVTASSNEVSVTSSTWVQEVSDTAKGLKDWEIACEFSGGHFCKHHCWHEITASDWGATGYWGHRLTLLRYSLREEET